MRKFINNTHQYSQMEPLPIGLGLAFAFFFLISTSTFLVINNAFGENATSSSSLGNQLSSLFGGNSTSTTPPNAPPMIPQASPSTPLQQGNTTGAAQGMSIYTNSTDGITLQYPSSWSTEDGQNAANDTVLTVVYVQPSIALDPTASISIRVDKDTQPPNNSSLNNYLRDTIDTYRSDFQDFKLLSADASHSMSAQPAYAVTYSWTNQDNARIKTLETGILYKGSAYYIHYSAPSKDFSKLLPQVDQIISSFTVRPPVQ